MEASVRGTAGFGKKTSRTHLLNFCRMINNVPHMIQDGVNKVRDKVPGFVHLILESVCPRIVRNRAIVVG